MKESDKTFVGYVPQANTKVPCAYFYKQIGTDKVYVGSTVNAYGRFIQHTSSLARGGHVNRNFQKAFDESPYFEVGFIPIPPERIQENPLQVVREMEQFLMDKYFKKEQLLNIASDVYACGASNSPTQETRDKISRSLKGRPVSEETRRRHSESLKGVLHSAERKAAISASKVTRPVVVDSQTYRSAIAAAKALGLNSKQAVMLRCKSSNFPNYGYADQLGNSPSL